MSPRRLLLLGMSVVGFVFPNTMVTVFFVRHGGVDLAAYFSEWFASLPASQLAGDIAWAFLAFSVWAAWEGRRLRMRTWWLPIPASLTVGLCFAIPLFLFHRERALEREPAMRA